MLERLTAARGFSACCSGRMSSDTPPRRERHGDTVSIADSQSEEHMTCVKVTALDDVEHLEADGERPVQIQNSQVFHRDGRRRPFTDA